MKSYDEMARSVLERAQVQIKRKKKMRTTISSVTAGCLAILMICVLVGGDTPALPLGGDTSALPSVGGQSSVAQQCFLQPVCYSNGEISTSSLDQSIPMQFVLEATDVQGRTEAEIEQIRRDKMQSLTQMEQAWTEEGYAYRISSAHNTYKGDAVIIYAATGGFRLDVEISPLL